MQLPGDSGTGKAISYLSKQGLTRGLSVLRVARLTSVFAEATTCPADSWTTARSESPHLDSSMDMAVHSDACDNLVAYGSDELG